MLETTAVRGLALVRLATIVASRLVLNTVFRVTYALTQFVVIRTRVSDQAAAWLVTVQVLAGLVGPLGGVLGDRYGYRRTMMWGLALATLGTTLIATTLAFPVLLVAFATVGVGTALYQPSMQAYVSASTPLTQRGRAFGAVELSWALAGIVGVPTITLLVERTQTLGWAFGLLAGLLALMWTTVLALPPEPTTRHAAQAPPIRTVLRQPAVLALLGFLWLAVCGSETLFIAQPKWLDIHFGLGPLAFAQALFVFGWGELGGSLLATLFTDRLGVRRAPLLGYGLAALVYLLLPIVSRTWPLYLVCFALFALAFEFAIVSSFSLVSAVYPPARGTVLAAGGAALQMGRAAGSQIGVPLLLLTGLVGNGVVAALLTAAGIALAMWRVQPQETAPRQDVSSR